MHFIDRKYFLLFLIFSGWMQTVIVNAQGTSTPLCPTKLEFKMKGDDIADQATNCAIRALNEFESLSNPSVDSLKPAIEITIKANEKLTYAVNAHDASQDKLDNAEQALNDAKDKMNRLIENHLQLPKEEDEEKECKKLLNLLRELSDIDKDACESKRRPGDWRHFWQMIIRQILEGRI